VIDSPGFKDFSCQSPILARISLNVGKPVAAVILLTCRFLPSLMAKLGHDGIPFEIGIDKTFRANDYGMLYFAMNDPFKWQYDNEGELDVAIYTSQNKSAKNTTDNKPIEIVAYSYDDKTGIGSLSSRVTGDHFQIRNWMISKIGEISSSKRVALHAGKESLQGGNYKVRDESTKDGILTIKFETLW